MLNLNTSADRRKCVFFSGLLLVLLGMAVRYLGTWIMTGSPWNDDEWLNNVSRTLRHNLLTGVVTDYAHILMYLGGAAMFIATWHWVKGRDAS